MLDPSLCRQFGAEFGEKGRLQRIKPGHPASHLSTDMVLGQTIGRDHDGVVFVAYRGKTIIWPIAVVLCSRVALLVVQGIVNWRLCRFIMGGQRPIFQPRWHKEPTLAIRLHDKRIAARNSIHTRRAGWWHVVRWLVQREIRYVEARPFLLLLIPPDVLLAL